MALHEFSFSSTTITNQNKFELNLGFSLGSHHDVTSRRVSAHVWLSSKELSGSLDIKGGIPWIQLYWWHLSGHCIYIKSYAMWFFAYLASFTWHTVFNIYLSYGIYQYFIPFYFPIVYNILFTHSLVGGHLGCFHFWLLWITMLYTFVCKFLCKYMSSFLLVLYLGVQLLCHMITLCLAVWGTVTLFSWPWWSWVQAVFYFTCD